MPMFGDSDCGASRYSTIRALTAYQGTPRRHELQRLFSTFPSGWPGVGLLLLRIAIGATAVIQGTIYLAHRESSTVSLWMIGLLALLGGAALMVGFLTPVAGGMVGIGAIAIACSWLPPTEPNLFDAVLPTVFVVIMATAVIFLGPGALSVDARLFGRREIIIPHTTRPRL